MQGMEGRKKKRIGGERRMKREEKPTRKRGKKVEENTDSCLIILFMFMFDFIPFLYSDIKIKAKSDHLVMVKWFLPMVSVNKLGFVARPLISRSMMLFENSSYYKVPEPLLSYLLNSAQISLSLNTHPNLSSPFLNSSNSTLPLSFRSK